MARKNSVSYVMFSLQKVKISEIKGILFPTRFFRDDTKLQDSIQNFGIFEPPFLIKKQHSFVILDGAARIEIAKKLNQSEIFCFVVLDEEIDQTSALTLHLELNHWSRDFNRMEMAMIYNLATKIFHSKAFPKSFWHHLGLRENQKTIQQLKDFLKLPVPIQKYAVNQDIGFSTILGFLRFPMDQIEQLGRYLADLPLNQNKLSEILSHLYDISLREEVSAVSILEEFFMRIEDHHQPQQMELYFRKHLNLKRNPNFIQKSEQFERKIKTFSLNSQTKITHSPFFEDDSIEISSKINSMDDIQLLIEKLKSCDWKELFKI